jgi:hypothetical protein
MSVGDDCYGVRRKRKKRRKAKQRQQPKNR